MEPLREDAPPVAKCVKVDIAAPEMALARGRIKLGAAMEDAAVVEYDEVARLEARLQHQLGPVNDVLKRAECGIEELGLFRAHLQRTLPWAWRDRLQAGT